MKKEIEVIKINTGYKTKKSKDKQELSDDFYSFSCPHCGKRIILDERKWISKN